MHLETVPSTSIHAIGYDESTQALEIVFTTGGIYRFVNVPPQEYQALMKAESKGRYFQTNIRNLYPYWRLHRPQRRKKQK